MAGLVVGVVFPLVLDCEISLGPGVGLAEPMSVRVCALATPAKAAPSTKAMRTAARCRQPWRISESMMGGFEGMNWIQLTLHFNIKLVRHANQAFTSRREAERFIIPIVLHLLIP